MIWPHIRGPRVSVHADVAPSVILPLQTAPRYQAQHQLAPATSQSLDRRWGEQETVTIETATAACSLTHLPALVWAETRSFYPYTGQGGERSRWGQGHREERGGGGSGVLKDGAEQMQCGCRCWNYSVRPLRSFRVPPPWWWRNPGVLLLVDGRVTGVRTRSEWICTGANANDGVLPVRRGATVKPVSGEDGQACRQDGPSSSSHSLSSSSSLCLYPIALTATSLSLSLLKHTASAA